MISIMLHNTCVYSKEYLQRQIKRDRVVCLLFVAEDRLTTSMQEASLFACKLRQSMLSHDCIWRNHLGKNDLPGASKFDVPDRPGT